MARKVILLRHGETEWSAEGNFAGWTDCDLTEKGKQMAREAGKALKEKGVMPSVVFTSKLRRSVCTAWLALMEADQVQAPVLNSWRLNERHYGILAGMGRAEAGKQHGAEKVESWFRDYDAAPPCVEEDDERHPCNDDLYSTVPKTVLPGSESMRATAERVLPFWNDQIAPNVQAGRVALVCGHGHSLRAVCQALEGLSDAEAMKMEVAPGVPLVYELSESLGFAKKYYLMDEGVVKARIQEAEKKED
eukprot:CAMPEP_0181454388 /NCGR_PEP_ID=MMETSP1110-20121109/30211_1 /TAXON_ID=174948 /ORGANISM="Symbiodinium sp., Strain CCMP421" /LENGTH=247 /DNA_ID=CAMNT_0023578729 /DNA_START=54 /DNA_END=797 /DNA_ORIENTATION=+